MSFPYAVLCIYIREAHLQYSWIHFVKEVDFTVSKPFIPLKCFSTPATNNEQCRFFTARIFVFDTIAGDIDTKSAILFIDNHSIHIFVTVGQCFTDSVGIKWREIIIGNKTSTSFAPMIRMLCCYLLFLSRNYVKADAI